MIATLHSFYFYVEISSPIISHGYFTTFSSLFKFPTLPPVSHSSDMMILLISMKKRKNRNNQGKEILHSPTIKSSFLLVAPPMYFTFPTVKMGWKVCGYQRPALLLVSSILTLHLLGALRLQFSWVSCIMHFLSQWMISISIWTCSITFLEHEHLLLIRYPFSATFLIFCSPL